MQQWKRMNMSTRTNQPQGPDVPPQSPQFQLGATSDEAEMEAQIANSPIPGPGGIVKRLQSQQWSLPRNDDANAEPYAHISRDTHGLPNG